MTKEEIVKRITRFGEEIDPNIINYDEKTLTVDIIDYAYRNNLYFDFPYTNFFKFDSGDNCVFNTGSNCTFRTGNDCRFITLSCCNFATENNCIFQTGSYSKFSTGQNCIFTTGEDCKFITEKKCKFFISKDCSFIVGEGSIYYRTDTKDSGELPANCNVYLSHKKGYILSDNFIKVSVGCRETELRILIETNKIELAKAEALKIFYNAFPSYKDGEEYITTQIIH